uniref:uncharacterized F-box/LRR-repeat protein C02F5.7-like n=1 Tax=Ciona intestinalis TaxID=7719 RepID=UPI0005212EA0
MIKPNHLVHIDLSRTSIVSSALSTLACIKGLQLKQVGGFSIKQLNLLLNLKELDISECPHVDMKSLKHGIEHLACLKVLHMKCCNFSHFGDIFNQVYPERKPLVVSPLGNGLRHLDIGSSKYLDDTALQAICIHFVNLEVLNMNWCSSVTDTGLLGLPSQQPTEEEQFLSSSKYTTNHGYSGLINSPTDEYKENDEVKIFKDDEILRCMEERGLVRLRLLRQLTLANCPKITSTSLLQIFGYNNHNPFPRLEKLDLGMLRFAVTNDSIIAITRACPRLNYFSMAFCSMVTDDFLKFLIVGMKSLIYLNLSNCDSITE